MSERTYQFLKVTAIVLAVAWVGWSVYDTFIASNRPGDYAYHAGSNFFADGNYEQALQKFNQALADNPNHIPALRGRAETLIMLNREHEAISLYDELLTLEPDNPGHYANRGIAFDRLGDHRQALADYKKALRLDPEVGTGPGWLTRFFRKQAEKPPGIAERAGYLEAQLALPADERLLKVPALDEAQLPYKQ